jgi:enoyl-CoA hydratase/carnithine racemase
LSSTASLVETKRVGPVRTITLNDPRHRNAISLEMRGLLVDALSSADTDARCRSVVIAGAGGNFSAGGDLSSMSADPGAARARLHAIVDVIRAVVLCSKPVIAAVDGIAFGAGLSLASACDVVVASRDARFCCAFSGVGLTADAGLHWSLPARVGYGRARMLIMLGRVVDSETAHFYGLVDQLTDGPSVEAGVGLAEEFARRAPLALAATKAILATGPAGLDEVLAREASAQRALLASEDFAEGRRAFFEKRRPEFVGR